MILTSEYISSLLPKRDRDCNKGDFGKLLCIVSSRDMSGAGIISANAAMRSGVGLCVVASVKDALLPLKISLPEAITIPLKSARDGSISHFEAKRLIEYSKGCSAVLIGCGLSNTKSTQKLVNKLISNISVPIILDADGINIVSQNIDILKEIKAPLIITPHLKEMSRLCKKDVIDIKSSKKQTAIDFSKRYGCYVVLKDFETVISTPSGDVFENLGGHPCMAKGGSGDMLAGMISGLIASGLSVCDAICSGVFLHARAGEICGNLYSDRSVLASDMISKIHDAFNSLN
jgi:NAD(P)H-hydrate epimerase